MKQLFLSLVLGVVGFSYGTALADTHSDQSSSGLVSGTLGVPFIENLGLHQPSVRFHADTFAGTFFVTDGGRLLLAAGSHEGSGAPLLIEQTWLRSRPGVAEGLIRSETVVRTSLGPDPEKWQRNAPAFDVVSLGQLYEGIELQLRAHGNNVEQLYLVAPGANPAQIEVGVEGVDAMWIESDGRLALDTSAGLVTFTAPVAFQGPEDAPSPVDVAYALTERGYRFELGFYDPSRRLVIDPLLQATYVGGRGSESVNALFVHPSNGDVYIAGGTTSTTFGVDDTVLASSNAYIARLNPDLTEFQFIQYMGGLGSESVTHVAIHPAGSPRAGEMVVMGPSDSDNWPAAGYGTRGFDSLFVGIFDTDLQTDYLRWISGSVHDRPTALAIHPSSYEVYIAGATNSTDFPKTTGGVQEDNAGIFDAFVARLRPDLSEMLQATYLGGYSGSEVEVSLAIDATEGIYLSGRTNSGNRGTIDDDNWPIDLMAPVETPQKDFGGGIEDLFVGLLDPELEVPRMVTYLGGNGIESSHVPRLLIHPTDGTVYVAGKTASDDADSDQGIQWSPGVFIARYTPEMDSLQSFATLTASDIDDILFHSSGSLYVLGTTADTLPTAETLDSLQDEFGGGFGDGFVARYDSDLVLTRATYLGGSDREGGQAFIEHSGSGALYVTGYTHSVDYPRTAGGAQSSNRGFQEGFVARLAADLSTRGESQSTYYGGSASDWSRVLAIDPDLGDVYIAGVTDSSDLLGMDGAAQPDSILDPEAFVALFDPTLAGSSAPEINVVPPSHDFGQVAVGSRSGPFEFTIENIGTADLIIQTISNSDATNFIVVANGGSNGCSPERPLVLAPAASCTFTAEFAPSVAASLAAEVTIESNDLDEGDLEVPLSGVGTGGNGGQSDGSEGCGCTVPGGPAAPGPLSVLVGLGLLALAWRRLRRRVR